MQWAGNVHMAEEKKCIQGFDGENGQKAAAWKT